MKKLFLIAAVFAVGMVLTPTKTQAQYNPYIYNNNAYLEYARAAARARAAKAKGKKKVVRKAARKKVVRRKSRRVSTLENMIVPKSKLHIGLPRRIDIV